MCAIRISDCEGHLCQAFLLDLDLGNNFEEAPKIRRPTVLNTMVVFTKPKNVELHEGMDFMLVGAQLRYVLGPLPHQLQWPPQTDSTGHVFLPKSSPAVAEAVEMFSSGLNAWTRAADMLPFHITMRVDCKPLACHMMTLNDRDREATGHETNSSVQEADVANMHLLALLRNEEAILASPPCQPFSSLGRGQGLDAYGATSWDSLFRVLRVTQRRYLVLENVCGLLKHPDFQEIIMAIRFCGYVLVAKRVCDATSISCAARPRVVLIFWNSADWHNGRCPQAQVPSIASLGPPVPCHCTGSIWEPMPEEILQDLLLTREEQELLGQRAFLPTWLRHSHRSVWELRKVQGDRPFPSVTAAYHRSASLPKHHVASKGLHVPVIQTSRGFRRLCKWEILRSMGLPVSSIIPRDEEEAISLIGESFPPAHAFEALLVALTLHPDRVMDQCQVDSFFQAGIQNLRPPTMAWESMTQISFQGWSKLVCRDTMSRELANLSWLVQSIWRTFQPGRLCFLSCNMPLAKVSMPVEKAFFEADEGPDSMDFKTYCPGWPPRWISLDPDDEVSHTNVVNAIADIWGLDSYVTLCVHATLADDPFSLVVDEISGDKVGKRLVFGRVWYVKQSGCHHSCMSRTALSTWALIRATS